jgi:Mlc titration factor MtfA (ptsG expression regulator)
MIFTWLQRRRRRKVLAQPFPEAWHHYLRKNVAHYRFLSAAEQAKLRDDLRIFIAEKNWEGCGGLQMTDEVRVTIAAQACLLVLALPHNYFERVRSILVYPSPRKRPDVVFARDGLILEGAMAISGEAHYRGPVILAWSEVVEEGRHPEEGHNVVYHEFAHQLDMLDGLIDGTPPLETPAAYRKWREVMTAEYQDLVRKSEQGRATLLDQYGTTNEGEFFAVATECFFNRPVPLRRGHPRLYDLLREYYHQDPAARSGNEPRNDP